MQRPTHTLLAVPHSLSQASRGDESEPVDSLTLCTLGPCAELQVYLIQR